MYYRFCGPVARGEEFQINDVVRSHNRKKDNNNPFHEKKIKYIYEAVETNVTMVEEIR